MDELQGAVVRLAGGGGVIATVEGNSAGSTAQAPAVPTVLRLDTTPAAGVQVLTTWPRSWVCVIRLSAFSTALRGVRVLIPVSAATTPPAGWYEAGIIHIGPVLAWGWDYSHGRAITLEHGTDVIEARDGTEIVEQLHQGRRAWEVTWEDPVPLSAYYHADPDYVSTHPAATTGIAYWSSTALDVMRQVRRVGGPLRPVVYLPRIDRSGLTAGYVVHTLREAEGAIYSRLLVADGGISIDAVDGDEGVSESVRVQRLTGREIR
jgi:hypothetical protein